MRTRTLCSAKIHRATVTMSDLHYVGSITIDHALLKAADILPYEQVQVVNITNGNRFTTYTIIGKENSGCICVNGAAARLVAPGDKIIIIAYQQIPVNETAEFNPRVIFVDQNNQITSIENSESAMTRFEPA